MTKSFLTGDKALAVIVLWNSGHFDTLAIASLLGEREDAIYRTLHLAQEAADTTGKRAQ